MLLRIAIRNIVAYRSTQPRIGPRRGMNRSRSSSAWLVIAGSPPGDGRRRLGLFAATWFTASRREDPLDDILDRWVLDRQVGDRQVAQDAARDLGRVCARDPQRDSAVILSPSDRFLTGLLTRSPRSSSSMNSSRVFRKAPGSSR